MSDLLTKNSALLKVVGVVFVGIHMPLAIAGLVWLGGERQAQALLLSVLGGTVAGFLISTLGIWSVLRGDRRHPIRN